MYNLTHPNMWDEHCAGSLTLKGRKETAKIALRYIQKLEAHIAELEKKVRDDKYEEAKNSMNHRFVLGICGTTGLPCCECKPGGCPTPKKCEE